MSKHLLWAALTAALVVALPSRSDAQSPSFQITPYAGYLKSGTILDGPVGTSIRGGGAPVYGAEAALGLTRGLYLVGNVAYSKPELERGAPVVGGLNVGETSVLLYDAALRLDIPLLPLPLISPFIQGGVGQMRQTIDVGPLSAKSTSLAYNVGAGVDLQVAPRVGVQVMAKDYFGKFDAKEATAINVDTKTTHNWVLSAGLRLGL
jgi:opacity protein-like surface antigen